MLQVSQCKLDFRFRNYYYFKLHKIREAVCFIRIDKGSTVNQRGMRCACVCPINVEPPGFYSYA